MKKKNKVKRDRDIQISSECIKLFDLNENKKYSRAELFEAAKKYLTQNDCLHDDNISINESLSKLLSVDDNSLLKLSDLESCLEKHITNNEETEKPLVDNEEDKSSTNNIFSEEDPWSARKTDLSQ